MLLAILAQTSALKIEKGPMLCLPDAPSSLWKLQEGPICPEWKYMDSPISIDLSIYRANTLQYKTEATVCKFIKSNRRLGLFGKKIEETVTEIVPVPTSTCARMRDMGHSPGGEINSNGIFRFTNNSLEVGKNKDERQNKRRTVEIVGVELYPQYFDYELPEINIAEVHACDENFRIKGISQ
jgi:hypothetical protein